MIDNIAIDWRKYVDHIYMIDYTKTTNDRSLMTKELKRLGIYDIDLLTIMMNISTPFYEKLLKEFNNGDTEEQKFLKDNLFYQIEYAFDTSMAHYFCIKQAYELGYDHIMVLENDVCFLRDKQYIKNVLDSCYNLYDNYHVFVLDNSNILDKNAKNIQASKNSYINCLKTSNTIYEYSKNDPYDLNMAGCTIYDKISMVQVINYYESFRYRVIDEYIWFFDECAYSFPPICIQQKNVFWYDIDTAELYTMPKFDYTHILKEYYDKYIINEYYNTNECDQMTLYNQPNYLYNYLKNGYNYIKKYCIGYQNDEDFKYFEKLYNNCILEQEVSLDDIDPDKLNIFILNKENTSKIFNSKNYKDILKDVINSDIIDNWDDNTINKFYKLFDNKIKECYEYIIANCEGYENDEDFKFFEKLYNRNILGQDISFDDIDKDKLDIFNGEI